MLGINEIMTTSCLPGMAGLVSRRASMQNLTWTTSSMLVIEMDQSFAHTMRVAFFLSMRHDWWPTCHVSIALFQQRHGRRYQWVGFCWLTQFLQSLRATSSLDSVMLEHLNQTGYQVAVHVRRGDVGAEMPNTDRLKSDILSRNRCFAKDEVEELLGGANVNIHIFSTMANINGKPELTAMVRNGTARKFHNESGVNVYKKTGYFVVFCSFGWGWTDWFCSFCKSWCFDRSSKFIFLGCSCVQFLMRPYVQRVWFRFARLGPTFKWFVQLPVSPDAARLRAQTWGTWTIKFFAGWGKSKGAKRISYNIWYIDIIYRYILDVCCNIGHALTTPSNWALWFIAFAL